MNVQLCSDVSRNLNEPLAGSAPQARLWVLLEQPGPWGREAVLESHLDSDIARELVAWADPHQVRLGLIRRPGRHADMHQPTGRRTVLIARSDPGHTWLRVEEVQDPRSLLDVDLAALLATPALPAAVPRRALLVCTNSRRDRCCALLGRPMVEQLAATWGDAVWETSHLGGHRFAPTVASLPDGYLYGGPTAATLTTRACRGRSTLEPSGQAAELAALTHLGLEHPQPLPTVSLERGRWHVDSGNGHPIEIHVTHESVHADRAKSCGKAAESWSRLVASVTTPEQAWQ